MTDRDSTEPAVDEHGVVRFPLRDRTTIPQLGFGLWQVDDATAELSVALAAADIERIAGLGRGLRYGSDPDEM